MKFDLTDSFGIDSYVSPFRMDFLGWIFVAMTVQGCVLFLIRSTLHWDLLQKHRGIVSACGPVVSDRDKDVEAEQVRVLQQRASNDVLQLHNLKKCYQYCNKKITAVNGVTLGVPRGECFGLLGVNGAGKTTTFKMLTGDIAPSAGRAIIRTPVGSEIDVMAASMDGTLIGYCPQQDALDELLTGWEHLYYYSRLCGIPRQHIKKVTSDLVNRLYLNAHVDKLVRTYSGGTKRKLSTALALIGKPHILLLRLRLPATTFLQQIELLQFLLWFGDGYSVKVWLKKETIDLNELTHSLQFHFPGTYLKEQHLGLLEYQVPYKLGCLAEMFRVLETKKEQLNIKHYSISQTTLDQVFINFAMQQMEKSEQ
nr:PREDICTED: ATP-binding cassette sub-family A member 13-like [Latimeria chalumnae]|eukprot:XP_014353291.1 PREDICTED: ATP-binding cassette sub-family A member 13-like [Latimeria chalumnae]